MSALDLSTQAQVLNLLADLRDERGLSYLFIAHDIAVVQFLAQRVVVLYRGQVMETGPAAAVTENPKHPFTAGPRGRLPGAAARRSRPNAGGRASRWASGRPPPWPPRQAAARSASAARWPPTCAPPNARPCARSGQSDVACHYA